MLLWDTEISWLFPWIQHFRKDTKLKISIINFSLIFILKKTQNQQNRIFILKKVLTLSHAMPKVFKFLTCALTLYFGYVVCGWLVLGPFNPKFRTLIITSQTLFSLLNGDDMFATFRMLEPGGPSFFSQFYLYSFICLFIYTVLSLFISVVMDSYETIKVIHHSNSGI